MAIEQQEKVVFDAQLFENEVKTARDATKPGDCEEETHLAKMELWTTLLGISGLALAVRGVVSPIAMILLGYYMYGKFAILAHHSLHGAWGLQRRGWYAQGLYRRIVDWLDWIFPMAWICEHNKHHHYFLNEDFDPDFVERNTETVQSWSLPLPVKYAIVMVQAMIWKWYYYASNTLKTLHDDKPNAPVISELKEPLTLTGLLYKAITGNPWYRAVAADFFFRVMGPPFFLHYCVIPILAGFLRWDSGMLPFCWTTLLNMIGAEIITNVHAFCTIVTNHAGSDLWHFSESCKPDTAEFFLRAILGSSAYQAGNDFIDYFHGFLNYQGEHHCFPALSPLHYQRLHPRLKEICAKHGVPYVQEPVWVRVRKTADVIVGVAKHKRLVGQCLDQPEMWMCAKTHCD
mmetsp:Transcript_3599/g.5815  ORF Transcript_3599/g.5815 Transcript_3599/m.5815 type:complete len:402 (+) Transcript_3599:50-1255(+)